MPITITEALAEIKTLKKRIDTKRGFINNYLARAEGVRDPLDREGGSPKKIREELQGVADLEQNLLNLRLRINAANEATTVTINDETRSIAAWIIWRRDIAPARRQWLAQVRQSIQNIRANAAKQGHAIVNYAAVNADNKPQDIVVNLSESELDKEVEALEDTLGKLDGQLSLKNATVLI